MKIMVQTKHNTYKRVQHYQLDDLIYSGEILAFRRGSGWVEIGLDPVRKRNDRAEYAGAERREQQEQLSCLTCPDLENSICKAKCDNRISPQGMVPVVIAAPES